MNESYEKFKFILAIPALSINSEEYGNFVLAKKRPEMYDWHPVGTGPYKLRSYTAKHVIYDRFNRYYRGSADIAVVDIKVLEDEKKRPRAVLTGECDIAADPDVNEFEKLKNSHAMKMQFIQKLGMNLGFLTVNHEKMTQPKLKLAMSLALDRRKYVREIFAGHAKPARSVLYPELNKEYRSRSYIHNPQRAKNLINELLSSGMDEKDLEIDFLYMPISRPYNPNGEQLGKMMKEDLEAVGFKISLRTMESWEKYWKFILIQKAHHVAQIGLNAVLPAPEDLYSIITTAGRNGASNNWNNWSHPEVDRLVDELRGMQTQEELQLGYNKIEQILEGHVPIVPILHGNLFRIVSNSLQGYRLHWTHAEDFYRMSFQ